MNPGPGTIVDHSVTARHHFDFYLVSQHVNQGTVSPTHYIVLRDGGQWPPDALQKISYKACHLYYNWCGTVRVPAPVQVSERRRGLVVTEARDGKDRAGGGCILRLKFAACVRLLLDIEPVEDSDKVEGLSCRHHVQYAMTVTDMVSGCTLLIRYWPIGYGKSNGENCYLHFRC